MGFHSVQTAAKKLKVEGDAAGRGSRLPLVNTFTAVCKLLRFSLTVLDASHLPSHKQITPKCSAVGRPWETGASTLPWSDCENKGTF